MSLLRVCEHVCDCNGFSNHSWIVFCFWFLGKLKSVVKGVIEKPISYMLLLIVPEQVWEWHSCSCCFFVHFCFLVMCSLFCLLSLEFSVAGWSVNLALPFLIVRMEISQFLWEVFVFGFWFLYPWLYSVANTLSDLKCLYFIRSLLNCIQVKSALSVEKLSIVIEMSFIGKFSLQWLFLGQVRNWVVELR